MQMRNVQLTTDETVPLMLIRHPSKKVRRHWRDMQLGDKTRKTSTCDDHVTNRSVVQGASASDLVCIHCEKSIFEISPIHLTNLQTDSVLSRSLNFSENHNQSAFFRNKEAGGTRGSASPQLYQWLLLNRLMWMLLRWHFNQSVSR